MRGLIPALWSAGATIAAPAFRHMLRRRAARGKEIAARLPEREGIDPTPRPEGPLVWLHAASVGESQSILPVIDALSSTPGLTILVTTGTVTSATLLAPASPGALHRFVPLDVPRWAARFLDHWRPDAAAFVESELWPNLLAACQARAIPMMLVNARMSARSLRAWQRAPAFARQIVDAFARIHPQSQADADRLHTLGATRLDPPGNLKLAAPPLPADPAELSRLQILLAGRPAWLAASTHPGEEDIAAQVHHRLAPTHPGLVTIIAPRHPDRGPALAAALNAPRRNAFPEQGGLWIADSLGELGLLYRLAPIVFVGRSLIGQGGQNPLEPARLACAIAMGPHTQNFADPVHRLQQAGALTTVTTPETLATWVDSLLSNPTLRTTQGTAAQQAANGEQSLPPQLATALLDLLPLPLGEGRGEGQPPTPPPTLSATTPNP